MIKSQLSSKKFWTEISCRFVGLWIKFSHGYFFEYLCKFDLFKYEGIFYGVQKFQVIHIIEPVPVNSHCEIVIFTVVIEMGIEWSSPWLKPRRCVYFTLIWTCQRTQSHGWCTRIIWCFSVHKYTIRQVDKLVILQQSKGPNHVYSKPKWLQICSSNLAKRRHECCDGSSKWK